MENKSTCLKSLANYLIRNKRQRHEKEIKEAYEISSYNFAKENLAYPKQKRRELYDLHLL